jgi:hypothetical protein
MTCRLLSADSAPVEPVHLYFLDLVAGYIEYDVIHKAGVDVDVLEQEGAFDERCPQPNSFSIVRCAAHQHIGTNPGHRSMIWCRMYRAHEAVLYIGMCTPEEHA